MTVPSQGYQITCPNLPLHSSRQQHLLLCTCVTYLTRAGKRGWRSRAGVGRTHSPAQPWLSDSLGLTRRQQAHVGSPVGSCRRPGLHMNAQRMFSYLRRDLAGTVICAVIYLVICAMIRDAQHVGCGRIALTARCCYFNHSHDRDHHTIEHVGPAHSMSAPSTRSNPVGPNVPLLTPVGPKL
jgi:hypothetical protein